MDGTQATLQATREVKRAARPAPKVDNKELRRVLRSVKKMARGDGSALWQPIAPGGPTRYDQFQEILLEAFKDQMAGSIRRRHVELEQIRPGRRPPRLGHGRNAFGRPSSRLKASR
jgi:hypothetical protein